MSVQARAHLFFFVLMVATGWSSNCGANPKIQADLPSSIEQTTDRVIEALMSRGFEVSRGYFRLYTQDDCEISFPVMHSCYGNNPAVPYVTFAVEPWGEEYLDPATRNAISLLEDEYTGTFRFDPKETILVFGRMPPPAAYFSLQTYLFTQVGSFVTNSDTYKWMEELPLTVLQVRDTSGKLAQPYDLPVLDERTAIDESPLELDHMRLVAAVNERWRHPCVTDDCSDRASDFIDLQGAPIDLAGPECTKIGMNCIGDNQDTSYQMTTDFLFDTGYVYAVGGTLGTRTGNATYVGLSLNDSYLIKWIANIDSDQLRNTASAYAADLANPSKFYLYYLTRDCAAIDELTDGNCFAVSDSEELQPVCTDLDSSGCHPLKLIQREYISKGTAWGPDSTLLLPPKLIRLKLP